MSNTYSKSMTESTELVTCLCCRDTWATGCKSDKIRTESSPLITQNEIRYPDSQQVHECILCSVLSWLCHFQYLMQFAKTKCLRRVWLCLLCNNPSERLRWQLDPQILRSEATRPSDPFISSKNSHTSWLQFVKIAHLSGCTKQDATFQMQPHTCKVNI